MRHTRHNPHPHLSETRSRRFRGGPRRHDHADPHGRSHHRGPRAGGRGRAQRGDVRAAVLMLLAEEPMHGYQLMQAIADRTGGVWRPSPGAIYPTISQLEDEELVTVDRVGGRKLASLTDRGRALLDDPDRRPDDPFAAHARHADAPDLRAAVHDAIGAARAVAASGNDAQVAAAHKVLTDAKKALYRILADDSADPGRADE